MKKNKQFKLLGYINEDNGVGWYRQVQPLKEMGKQNLTKSMITEFTGNMKALQLKPEEIEDGVKWADIFYITSARTQQQAAMAMVARDWGKCHLVVDIDDNVLQLNEDHPNYYNFSRIDSSPAEWALQTLKYADLAITTNFYLKNIFENYNKNWYIMPNAINFKEWDKKVWEKANKKNKKISIGWAGASGHKHDLELLKKAVKEIKSKYKNVEFVLFGDSGNKEWFNYDRQIDWTPIFKYPESYAKAGCDIMIAPMRDSKYNRGKSSLRILEAGSLSIPVVASPVGDYVNFPVLYAKTRWDWTKQLEKLIENKSLRRKLGNKLYRKIKKDHNIKIEAKKLYKELAKLKDKRWKSKYNWKKKLEK